MREQELAKEYKEVWAYYSEALVHIQEGNIEKATKVLYNSMSAKLYDLSIDILYNRNADFAEPKLRDLITQVDTLLIDESIEEIPELEDEFDLF